jgi:hypothetical protein
MLNKLEPIRISFVFKGNEEFLMARWRWFSLLAMALLAPVSPAAAESGPADRECMAGEQRIEGSCQPLTRGAQNKGSSADSAK